MKTAPVAAVNNAMTTNDQGRDEFIIERTALGVVFRDACGSGCYGVYLACSGERVHWFYTLSAALNQIYPPPSQDAPTEIRHSRYEETELEKLKRKP